MSVLLNGDCLEQLSNVEDNSVDFIFCDLPYGQTSCKWDIIIPWEPFWKEIMRVKKLNTPVFFTTTTKFGVQLINSAPKKMPFRYDLVWVKSAPAGFLQSRKMPMRKHEMVYVFYEKLPLYDLSSHQHKFIKEEKYANGTINSKTYDIPNKSKGGMYRSPAGQYDPPLPTSVVKEEGSINNYKAKRIIYTDENGNKIKEGQSGPNQTKYDPPLPNSILEVNSTRGKHSTEKPVALMEWLLKYYSKQGDTVLDPTMGSGSTGVACKNMKRNFIGIEKDPDIYQVAVNRIED